MKSLCFETFRHYSSTAMVIKYNDDNLCVCAIMPGIVICGLGFFSVWDLIWAERRLFEKVFLSQLQDALTLDFEWIKAYFCILKKKGMHSRLQSECICDLNSFPSFIFEEWKRKEKKNQLKHHEK